MNQSIKFAVLTAWIIFSRAFDAFCTYQHTPDLRKEANPLVSVIGMNWSLLLAVVGGLTVYTIFVFFQRLFRPEDLMPSEKGMSFGDFSAWLYFGKKEHWSSMIYKIPGDWRRFNQWMGVTLPACMSFAGVVSTAMWLLINGSETYRKMHGSASIYAILIIGSLAMIVGWHLKMFKKYQYTER